MTTCCITGATGYIGSALVRYLLKKEQGLGQMTGIRILAPVRDLQKAARMFPEGVEFLQTDLCDRQCVGRMLKAGNTADYLIHCASVTKSEEMTAHPVEVTESIVDTTKNILEFARHRRIKSMVYLSSMEVYGKIDCGKERRTQEWEACRGEVEILNARSCYPMGKRMAESLCYSYYKEYGIPVKIARLAQTFGKEIMDTDNRVYAQFARAAKNGRNIVLHTDGSSMGNYCELDDAVRGILMILEKGKDGEAYNVVNEENTMTIRQMAELVADRVAGGKIRVVCERTNENSYAPYTGLRLSGKKLESLGWRPTKTLYDMYQGILTDQN